MDIFGDVSSLKKSDISQLESLYDLQIGKWDFIPKQVVDSLVKITAKLGREVGVYIDRKGRIDAVFIGDSSAVSLPTFEGRRDKRRLSGVRCIHTHPDSSGRLSTVDVNSLLTMKFDAMIAIGISGEELKDIFAGVLTLEDGEYCDVEIFGPLMCDDSQNKLIMQHILDLDKDFTENAYNVEIKREKAILVGLDLEKRKLDDPESLLDELEELSITADMEVLAKITQKKQSADSRFFMGKGKIQELSLIRQALEADVLIFDDELTGAQIRNIERIVGIKVIDRTSLILDIFAKRAHSKAGALQVELAQLKYRLPRLMGLGHVLSRLGGGIGTRGPGEKKLETDRRHIRRKIETLEKEIKNIGKKRDLLREGRSITDMPTVAIVGYTNAGKSTLLNALSNSNVYVEDKLFATLDPTSRGVDLFDGRKALMVDTVGFIRKLPHQLVEAFKSTLEEVLYADLLLHVVDVTNDEYQSHIKTVNELLASLGVEGTPMLIAYNKMDKLQDDVVLSKIDAPVVEISAKAMVGLENLKKVISELLAFEDKQIKLLAPYDKGWVYPYLCDNGKVLKTESRQEGMYIEAIIDSKKYYKVQKFEIDNQVRDI